MYVCLCNLGNEKTFNEDNGRGYVYEVNRIKKLGAVCLIYAP